MRPPILIVGQGLAGTAFAWHLLVRNVPFLIVDRHEPLTSSKVAAGLVTPITGMRLNLSWRYESLYPEALRFYRAAEQTLRRRFFYPRPIVRLLRDEEAANLWIKRMADPAISRFVKQPAAEPIVDEAVFNNPFGGFEQKHAGWLDTSAFIEATRRHFLELGCWQQGEVKPEELVTGQESVEWQGRTFRTAVFCTGWEAAKSPWFDWVPFRSARGTVLTIETDIRNERRIVNRGCWVLPLGDGKARVGPTYELDFDDPNTPAPESIAALETKLRGLLKSPYRVTGSQTAVRPIIRGCHALLGRHPAQPAIAFFNGLGSKGVLRAPWAARQLVEHLLDAAPLAPELDLARNL